MDGVHLVAVAWEVTTPTGFRALFLDLSRAEFWAIQCKGTIRALVYA